LTSFGKKRQIPRTFWQKDSTKKQVFSGETALGAENGFLSFLRKKQR